MENQNQDETPHYDFITFRREVFALDAADRIAFVKSEIKRFRIEARFYGNLVRLDNGVTIEMSNSLKPKKYSRNIEDYYLNLTELLRILEDSIKPLQKQPAAAELLPDSEPIRMKQATAARIALALTAGNEILQGWTQADIVKLFREHFRNENGNNLRTLSNALKNQNSKIDIIGSEQITYDKVKEHLAKILTSDKTPLKSNEKVTKRK
ncbi:hypothetical protein MASR2M18_17250 [Ignavibacteria bacterium]